MTVLESKRRYHISYNNLNGWVSAQYAKVTPGASTGYRITVNLRSGPGTSHAVVGQARQETPCFAGKGRLVQGADRFRADLLRVSQSGARTAAQAGTATPDQATTTSTAMVRTSRYTWMANCWVLMCRLALNRAVPGSPLLLLWSYSGLGQSSQIVTATRQEVIVQLPIGSKSPTVNGIVWPLDVPAKIVGDRTLAPLRFVGEAFGGKVEWNEAERTIHIESPEPPSTPAVATPSSNKLVVVQGSTVNLREDGTDMIKYLASGFLPVLAEKDGWFQVTGAAPLLTQAGWCACRR